MDFSEQLAALVFWRRKKHRLSQAQLAALAGVGRRFVSELERGKQSLQLDKVLAVLDVLGLSLACIDAREVSGDE
ncbi:MAG: helix-turn-helix transcriptional regulator [Planctomycetes bacterium]|jgi:HTH-type transcriptional regulator / antitoxin HipB|nr:helix-turn-helix transcriptional regulator [Planctomycetota bacterium]